MRVIVIAIIIVMSSCASTKVSWDDNIKNPSNDEFIDEVAFNLGINKSEVTQEQFNKRYNH